MCANFSELMRIKEKTHPDRKTVATQYGGFVTKHTGHAGEQGINNNCKCAVCRIFRIFAESRQDARVG